MAKLKKLPRRNPMHDHPLLAKGGLHQKPHKANRRLEKIKMKKEWLPQNNFVKSCFGEAIQS